MPEVTAVRVVSSLGAEGEVQTVYLRGGEELTMAAEVTLGGVPMSPLGAVLRSIPPTRLTLDLELVTGQAAHLLIVPDDLGPITEALNQTQAELERVRAINRKISGLLSDMAEADLSEMGALVYAPEPGDACGCADCQGDFAATEGKDDGLAGAAEELSAWSRWVAGNPYAASR